MKLIHTYCLIVLLSTTTASAGCANFEDGSLEGVLGPRYRICYDNVCDETRLSYVCSNIFGIQQGFANGWATDFKVGGVEPESYTITWQGRIIDKSKYGRLRFEEICD
jgi:hypothetical protein